VTAIVTGLVGGLLILALGWIKLDVNRLGDSIDRLGERLTARIDHFSDRLDNLSDRVAHIEGRLDERERS
jgi:hypothetical protein